MLDLVDLVLLMSECIRFVCVMYCLNILGLINFIWDIVDFVYVCNVKICVDVVVYVFYWVVDVQVFDVDYYVFSFYKIYGLYYVLMYG